METKLLFIPLKDGCHIEGANLGIDVIQKKMTSSYKQVRLAVPEGDAIDVVHDVCNELAREIELTHTENRFPLVIGGDHALGIGSVAAASKRRNVGIVWLDAHGDINTPQTSPTMRLHGMPLAISLGLGHEKLVNCHYPGAKITDRQIVFVGSRDFDAGEVEYTTTHQIPVHTYQYIKSKRLFTYLQELDRMLEQFDEIHLSFDLDVMDPLEFGALNVPVAAGFTKAETKHIIAHLFSQHHVSSMDIVEYNPLHDHNKDVMFLHEIIDMIEECNRVYDQSVPIESEEIIC